jgi:hypothetical protein
MELQVTSSPSSSRRTFAALAVLLATLFGASAFAQSTSPRRVPLAFAKGASSAMVTGRITGGETVDYVVRAAAGQTLAVTLTPSNPSNYFNVLPPGSDDEAMYNGQNGEPFRGLLPTDGSYRVRVYLMRNEARRHGTSSFTLSVEVTGKPLLPLPAARDALVPGTHYHATAPIACLAVPYGDKAPSQCDAGVVRRGHDGTATVAITLGTTRTRHVLFVAGKAVASDSMHPMTASHEGDETVVKFESGEYYRVPDVLLFGG